MKRRKIFTILGALLIGRIGIGLTTLVSHTAEGLVGDGIN